MGSRVAPPLQLSTLELKTSLAAFEGPHPLVRRGLPVPASAGVYVIASGRCVSHIGTSGKLRGRLGQLAGLGTHRGSAEVLCAAYCTGAAPQIWWLQSDAARDLERRLKVESGEPPTPRTEFSGCVNGDKLRHDLIAAAGANSWEAGYLEAVFAIGEKLSLLFQPHFRRIWLEIGVPPGPWQDLVA